MALPSAVYGLDDPIKASTVDPAAICQIRRAHILFAFGILAMTLQPNGYRYRFVPVAGSPGRWVYSARRGYKIFKNSTGAGPVDSGAGTCHGAP